MRLSADDYEFIREMVAHTLINYGSLEIPIDPFIIAKNMGIRLIPYSALPEKDRLELISKYSEDGCGYELPGKDERIFYNDEKPPLRIRMTLFHELGHFALGHPKDMEPARAESEANFFAKYAIAPVPLILALGLQDAGSIRSTFGVSLKAAGYIWKDCNNRIQHGGKWEKSYEKELKEHFSICLQGHQQ